jgi:tRNA1(Val) A37 N6-methylase TrmN6
METINYLLGYKNLKLYQNEDMFKFSIDSILLPNFVTLTTKTNKILDIGTGNAVIPIVLTTKTNAKIDAVEIQKEVFELGLKSIKCNNLDNKINIYNMDIKDYISNLESDIYDTITCNPPFFKINETSIVNDSDYKTIARHEVKLNIDDLMKIARKMLKNNGNIAIVHRTERLIDIIECMRKNNIEPKKIQFVYPKKNKESNILLIEGVKNGNPGIKILDSLYIHNEDGTYTEQVMKYFEN